MRESNLSVLEQMRQEDTQYALFYINKTPELLEKYLKLKNAHMNNKFNSEYGNKIAYKWAKDNNDEFGDLFITELELVRWNKVLRML